MTFYVIPFWVTVTLLLRCFFNVYTSILVASILFGAVEIMKARKSDDFVWKRLRQDIDVIGHRACAINAPENTLAGVREAVRLGVKAVEIDISITSDGEPVIMHDNTVDRTTDGTGRVADMSLSELQQLDATAKFVGSGSFPKEKVPHLREMLAECKKYGLTVFLDMKGSRPVTMAKALKAMTDAFPDLHEWAVVCSFYPYLLYAVKWHVPQFVTILTHRPWVLSTKNADGELREHEMWKKAIYPVADVLLELSVNHFLWYFCGANAVFVEQETVSISSIKYWNARGLDMVVWTVNKPYMKAYLRSLGIPYITDDCSQ